MIGRLSIVLVGQYRAETPPPEVTLVKRNLSGRSLLAEVSYYLCQELELCRPQITIMCCSLLLHLHERVYSCLEKGSFRWNACGDNFGYFFSTG